MVDGVGAARPGDCREPPYESLALTYVRLSVVGRAAARRSIEQRLICLAGSAGAAGDGTELVDQLAVACGW
jgi:hypothetical protein